MDVDTVALPATTLLLLIVVLVVVLVPKFMLLDATRPVRCDSEYTIKSYYYGSTGTTVYGSSMSKEFGVCVSDFRYNATIFTGLSLYSAVALGIFQKLMTLQGIQVIGGTF